MNKKLLLPCLRGVIGDWVTYTCLMRLVDIRELIKFAEDVHSNKKLSRMIQRELKKDRQKEIGEYLLNDEEAFFNSMVAAIYEGEPQWHQFESINSRIEGIEKFEVNDYAKESVGFLSLSKSEKIFALDGQHRLSGIQYALERNPDLGLQQIPVTFLGHHNDQDGIRRTRRLFTTLNKRAKPVNKAAIIALDGDDLSACATRYLVEDSNIFSGDIIKFQANNSVSYADREILTTIGNLYDLVKCLLTKGLKMKPKEVDNFRGSEAHKNEVFTILDGIFDCMFSEIPCLVEFMASAQRSGVVVKFRNRDDGGHFLYRPVGLKIYVMAMCNYATKLHKGSDFLDKAKEFVVCTKDKDLSLSADLLNGVLWDSEHKKILKLSAEARDGIVSNLIEYADNKSEKQV